MESTPGNQGRVSDQKLNQNNESTLNTVDTRQSHTLADNKLGTHKEKKIQESKTELEEKYKCQEDQGIVSVQKLNQKNEATLNTVDTRESDTLTDNKLRTHKEKKIQESKTELEEKYKCQEGMCKFCEKRFKNKANMCRHVHEKTNSKLNTQKIEEPKQEPAKKDDTYSLLGYTHQKTTLNASEAMHNYDKSSPSYSSLAALKKNDRLKHASVKPQFICDVCGYKANRKSHLSNHISSRHFKNTKKSQARHDCNECSRSYRSLGALKRHERFKHTAGKPQLTCYFCGYKTNVKCRLSSHITSRHLKNTKKSQTRYDCDKCYRSYSSLSGLCQHNRLIHSATKPEFICDDCGYKTYMKFCLSVHISSRHFNKSSQAWHNCDKCSRSYSSLGSLNQHNRLKHVAGKPQFTCYFCGYKTSVKFRLPSHIASHHFKELKTSQARYDCDKCFRSYSSFSSLYYHKRLIHAAVRPQFTCDICGYKTNLKSNLSRHISRHFKNSKKPQARHDCHKCFRSYRSVGALMRHERLKHAAVKPQFTCYFCGYKTKWKANLSRHISSLHFKNSKKSEARYDCDKYF